MKSKITIFSILFLIGAILSSIVLIQRVSAQSSDLEIVIGSGGNIDGGFKYYCQGYPAPWRNNKYDSGTIGSSGCGPSSLAMILATYGLKARQSDSTIATPVTVARLFEDKGIAWFPGNHSCLGGKDCVGSSPSKMVEQNFLNSVGLKRSQVEIMGVYDRNGKPLTHSRIQQLRDFTQSGWYVLAAARNWCGAGCNHEFVVVDADPSKDTITVASASDNCTAKDWRYTTSLSALNRKGITFMSLVPVKQK